MKTYLCVGRFSPLDEERSLFHITTDVPPQKGDVIAVTEAVRKSLGLENYHADFVVSHRRLVMWGDGADVIVAVTLGPSHGAYMA